MYIVALRPIYGLRIEFEWEFSVSAIGPAVMSRFAIFRKFHKKLDFHFRIFHRNESID